MKRGTLATVLTLVGLLAAPAGAQMMPPGQMPQPYPYAGSDPYAMPPSPDEAAAYPPDGAYQQVPDLDPDNEIAETYDDGYDPQAYQEFQDALAPYGTWTNDDSYGYVWTPAASIVGASFTPYSSCGHWVRSEYGWTWASDWNWGWAPFHYGRWIVRANHWAWVPGTMWGPAWVSWRSGDGYVGWAPLPPRGVRLAAWTRVGSPWRFTTVAGLCSPRPTFLAPRYLPALFARTTVVSTDRLLTHDNWRVHVNAGPVRGVTAPIVPLSRVAPAALPRVAVYPHRGMPEYERPWVRGPEARRDPLTAGWHAGTPVVSSHATFGRPAWSNAGPSFTPRPMTSASNGVTAPTYGRPAPGFAGHSSAGSSMSFAPRPSFQPPAPRPSFQPAPRPSFQPAPRPSFQPAPRPSFQPAPRPSFQAPPMHPAAPPPHAFTPPPNNGAFRPFAGAPPSGGGFGHFAGAAPHRR